MLKKNSTQYFFFTALGSGLIVGAAFAESFHDYFFNTHNQEVQVVDLPEIASSLNSEDTSEELSLMSHSAQEPSLKDGVETGTWGTCNWEWDHSTETITVYPGTAGAYTATPWYRGKWAATNPNGGVKHIIFVAEGNNKVRLPSDCKVLFCCSRCYSN